MNTSSTSDETGDHDRLPDYEPKRFRDFVNTRMVSDSTERFDYLIMMGGLKDVAKQYGHYEKAVAHVLTTGLAAGLPLERVRPPRGSTDAEKLSLLEALALVHPAGTPDYVRLRDFMALPDSKESHPADVRDIAARPSGQFFRTEVLPDGKGGMEARITVDERASKEARLNEAISALDDPAGRDPQIVAAELAAALHNVELTVDDDVLKSIAAELVNGEGVVVEITPQS